MTVTVQLQLFFFQTNTSQHHKQQMPWAYKAQGIVMSSTLVSSVLPLRLAKLTNLVWSRVPVLINDVHELNSLRINTADVFSRHSMQKTASFELDVVVHGLEEILNHCVISLHKRP